jgi:WD40 repeat protein
MFSPDGELIATASADGTARLWKTDGTPVAVLQGHTGSVTSVVFSSDGTRILTGSADGTARQYLVNIEDLLAVAACQVSRGMTQEELDSFGIDEPRFAFTKRQCPPVFSWEQ